MKTIIIAVCLLIVFVMYACCIVSAKADKKFHENDNKYLDLLIFLQK